MNVKGKLGQALGLGILLVAAAGGLWHFHATPTRDKSNPGPNIQECATERKGCGCMEQATRTTHVYKPCCAGLQVAVLHGDESLYYECESPEGPPPEPWREPTMWPHWPSCSVRPLVQQQEDAALVAVLASTVEDDELFGGSEMRMEAASCASYRWRMAGR